MTDFSLIGTNLRVSVAGSFRFFGFLNKLFVYINICSLIVCLMIIVCLIRFINSFVFKVDRIQF